MAATTPDAATKFKWLNMAPKTVTDTLANPKLTAALVAAIDEAGITGEVEKAKGALLYTAVSKLPLESAEHRRTIAEYISSNKLKSTIQVEAAVEWFAKNPTFNASAFEAATGVGVVVSEDEIKTVVKDVIESNKAELSEKRYRYPAGLLIKAVTQKLKWADSKLVKDIVEAQYAAFLGPKTEADEKPLPKKEVKKPVAEKKEEVKVVSEAESAASVMENKWPAPQDNPYNTPEILAEHLKRTGGKVRTRFPPEPNGYLHVGHAKAMFIDFGQAMAKDGVCYLRYDDTNPDAEKQEYIDGIAENVAWMGYHPWKVTFASDHFQKLYELAQELIRRDCAYVCHQTGDEISKYREEKKNSPWRDRSVEENLRLFEDMRKGKFAEGEATLRMKMDMQASNTVMRDLIAYRVIMSPHHRTGDAWCIYPSYDYAHCICDSLEDITHSLCTLEFNIRRESYYWVLEKLGMYKPIVWEYSRLSLTQTIVSKRNLRALVEEGYVRGWDDPRMPTLVALRRKGFSPAAIKAMCEKVGVSRSSDTLISYELLESCVRADLDSNARRTFIVLEPLKVTITNFPEGIVEMKDAPNFPADKSGASGSHQMPFSRVIYIDRSDFRLQDEKSFYGLSEGKEVGLKYAYNIKCTKVIKNGDEVVALEATYDPTNSTKTKGHIHWVAEPAAGQAPASCEVRVYEHIFTKADMTPCMKQWKEHVNPKSETIYTGAFVEPSVVSSKIGTCFQAERVGYFCVDTDTKPGNLVFNRTVPLKESYCA